jgi:hypothetical protein
VRGVLTVVAVVSAGLVGGSNAAGPSDAVARDVSYFFHAQFDVEYEVDWVETSGDRLSACSYWTDDRGSTSVSAGSLTWIPGQLRILGRATPTSWGQIVATGARPRSGRVPANARVEMTRRLVQRGGTTPGCTTAPPPFRAPSNDCGETSFTTRAATIMSGTLESRGTLGTLLASGRKFAIRVTTPLPRPPYRKCMTTRHAPEFPTGLPVGVRHSDLAALRTLKEGEKHAIRGSYAGHCTTGLSATESCHYDLHITVTIRRWVSRVRCGSSWCPNRFP